MKFAQNREKKLIMDWPPDELPVPVPVTVNDVKMFHIINKLYRLIPVMLRNI